MTDSRRGASLYYCFCLALVGLAIVARFSTALLDGQSARLGAMSAVAGFAEALSSPIPAVLFRALPQSLQMMVVAVFGAMVTLRLHSFVRVRRIDAPLTLTTWPLRLLKFSVWSIAAMLSLMSLLLASGTYTGGVVAGVLGLPGLLMLSTVTFYVEARAAWAARR